MDTLNNLLEDIREDTGLVEVYGSQRNLFGTYSSSSKPSRQSPTRREPDTSKAHRASPNPRKPAEEKEPRYIGQVVVREMRYGKKEDRCIEYRGVVAKNKGVNWDEDYVVNGPRGGQVLFMVKGDHYIRAPLTRSMKWSPIQKFGEHVQREIKYIRMNDSQANKYLKSAKGKITKLGVLSKPDPLFPDKGVPQTGTKPKRTKSAAPTAGGSEGDGAEIARTIIMQMGGIGRIKAMTGARNFIHGRNWASFQFPNKMRSKPNFVKVTLNGLDLYDVEFGRLGKGGLEYKKLKTFDGAYNDMLVDLFERTTGLYLRL